MICIIVDLNTSIQALRLCYMKLKFKVDAYINKDLLTRIFFLKLNITMGRKKRKLKEFTEQKKQYLKQYKENVSFSKNNNHFDLHITLC